jgi:hypothetical protein
MDAADNERIVQEALGQFARTHPRLDVPPPLKWAAGIAAAFTTASVIGLGFWLVSTVNTMQVTLARMDERSVNQTANLEVRLLSIEKRLTRLELAPRSAKHEPFSYPPMGGEE